MSKGNTRKRNEPRNVSSGYRTGIKKAKPWGSPTTDLRKFNTPRERFEFTIFGRKYFFVCGGGISGLLVLTYERDVHKLSDWTQPTPEARWKDAFSSASPKNRLFSTQSLPTQDRNVPLKLHKIFLFGLTVTAHRQKLRTGLFGVTPRTSAHRDGA